MSDLMICNACEGFTPVGQSSCLHCKASLLPRRRTGGWVRNAVLLVGGASLSMTLAACYGDPCASGGDCGYYGPGYGGVTETCGDPILDLDLDGHCGEFDCDEENAEINSSAPDELGDDVDTNCDGEDGIAMSEPDAGPSDDR